MVIEMKNNCISFKVLRGQTDGYRTLELQNGVQGDHIGIEIETKEGDCITLGFEVLPNGLHNIYPISSNYVITQPPTGLHRTTGKLTKLNNDDAK